MGRVLVVCFVFLLAACSKGTPIHVTNQSPVPLERLSVSGTGFSATVAEILPPGETRTVRVDPRGESGVIVSFQARGTPVTVPEQGYFEGNGIYAVYVVVKPDHSVSVSARTRL